MRNELISEIFDKLKKKKISSLNKNLLLKIENLIIKNVSSEDLNFLYIKLEDLLKNKFFFKNLNLEEEAYILQLESILIDFKKKKYPPKIINSLNKDLFLKIEDLIIKNVSSEDLNHIYIKLEDSLKNKIFLKKPNLEEEIYILQLESVLIDFKKITYEKKIITEHLTIYYYKNYIDIYIKNKTRDLKYLKELIDSEMEKISFLIIFSVGNNKKIITIKKNEYPKKLENFFKAPSIINYKIRLTFL